MDAWQALVLGLVEGLTEYLPVSSTGHLILAQRAMGIAASDRANAFVIAIQAGAIVAVLGLYRERVLQALRGVIGRDANGRRLALNLIAAFLPAAVIGKLFDEEIERRLFGLWPVVGAWAVGGIAILAFFSRGRREATAAAPLEALRPAQAVAIGLIQCLAMWPGTSRSLATIAGGLLCGLTLAAAVEFSFLLGVLTLGAATGYKAIQHGSGMLAEYGASNLSIGFAAAAIAAALSVKWMVSYLNRRGLAVFGWYRIGLAAVVGVLLAAGALAP